MVEHSVRQWHPPSIGSLHVFQWELFLHHINIYSRCDLCFCLHSAAFKTISWWQNSHCAALPKCSLGCYNDILLMYQFSPFPSPFDRFNPTKTQWYGLSAFWHDMNPRATPLPVFFLPRDFHTTSFAAHIPWKPSSLSCVCKETICNH